MQNLFSPQEFINVAQEILTNGGWQKHFMMGNLKRKNRKFESALQSYECALKFKDVNIVEVMTAKADTLRELGRDEEALQSYVKAIEADPSAADAFYGKALVLSSMGHQESAVSYYRKLLIMKPHDSKFYIAFANYLLKLNIVEQALQNYSIAANIEELPEAYHGKGVCMQRLGMHDMALKNLEHAIKLDPNSISIHISRGVTYFSLEQYQKAVIDFSYVLQIDPDNHEAHNNLGAVLDAMGKSEQAVDQYKKAIQIEPSYAEALNNKAIVLKRKGKIHESLQCIQSAVKLKPDDPLYLCNRALIYNMMGDSIKAQKDFLHASKMFRQQGGRIDLSCSNICFVKEAVEQFEDLITRTEKVRNSTSVSLQEVDSIVDKANMTLANGLGELMNHGPITKEIFLKFMGQFEQLKKKVGCLEVQNKVMQQKLENHEARLVNIEKYVVEIVQPMRNKIFPQIVIQERLRYLEKEHPERRLYIQLLHSSINSYLQSFRMIQSGLFQVKNPFDDKLMKTIVQSVFSFCGSTPIIGEFAKKFGELVVGIMDYRQKQKFEETKQKIIFILRLSFSEEQICYQIMSAIIQMTERPAKTWEIDNPSKQLSKRREQLSAMKKFVAKAKDIALKNIVQIKEKINRIFGIETSGEISPTALLVAQDVSIFFNFLTSTSIKKLPCLRDIILKQITRFEGIVENATGQIGPSDLAGSQVKPLLAKESPTVSAYLYNNKLDMYLSHRGDHFQLVKSLNNATKWSYTEVSKNKYRITKGKLVLGVSANENVVITDEWEGYWMIEFQEDEENCEISCRSGKKTKVLNFSNPKKKWIMCGTPNYQDVIMRLEQPSEKNQNIWKFQKSVDMKQKPSIYSES